MATDVLIDPTSGQIYWNDGTGSPESIAIKGDAINTISFTGYSASFSPGSTPAGALTLVTVKDSAGTDALIPGTTGYNLGSSTLRWNTFSSNANLSGTLVVSDSTISSSLITGSTRINGGIAISGNASIGQSLNFYNTAATFYTGFRAGTISANTLYTLPTAFPGSASFLQSDASGTLTWVGSIGTATTATNVNVVSASTSASHPVLFTPATGTASGAAVSTESSFVYNPSTDILSVSGLAITSGTASTNTTTGALVVRGGLGVTGQLSFARASFGFTGITTNPTMSFIGATSSSPITLTVLTDNSLNFEGSQGSVFSIDSNLSTGEIFSVSDISGLPIISASAGQTVTFNEFGGFTRIGNGSINSSSTTTGSLFVSGGLGITGNAFIGGTASITSNQVSISPSSGALVVTGGVGIGGSLYVASATGISGVTINNGVVTGNLTGTATTAQNINVVNATTNSAHPLHFSPSATGSGLATSSNATLSFNPSSFILSVSGLAITSGTGSSNTTTGAFVVTGGVGIGQTLNVGNELKVQGTSASTSTTTGALTVSGGVGIGQSVIIGGRVGIGTAPNLSMLNIQTSSAGTTGLSISASPSQSAPLFEWSAASGGGRVRPSGELHIGNGTGFNLSSGATALISLQGRGSNEGLAIRGFNSGSNEIVFETQGNPGNQLFAIFGDGGVNAPRINITNSTGSTNTSTGALIVTGGVGIGQSVSIGGRLQMFNGANFTAFVSSASGNTVYTLPATSPATGSSVLQSTAGGVMSWVPMTAGSSSGNTSQNIVINTAGNANVFHPILFTPSSLSAGSAVSSDLTISFNPSTAILSVSGLAITSGIASTTSTTGALVVTGGVGIGGSLYVASATAISGVTINAGVITGTLSGYATTARNTDVSVASTNATHYITFTTASSGSGLGQSADNDLTYNPSTNLLTSGTFSGNLSATAATATNFFGTLTGNVTGNLTGTATTAQNVNLAAGANASNHSVVFSLNATGTGIALSSDAGLQYNPSTNVLTADVFSGNASGTAATYTNFYGTHVGAVTGNVTGNVTGTATTSQNINTTTATTAGVHYLLFSPVNATASGVAVSSDAQLQFNPGTNVLTADVFSGNVSATAVTSTNFFGTLTGNVTGVATTAQNINLAAGANNSNHSVVFSLNATGTGIALSSDAGLQYNPSTNVLTADVFSGNFTGTAITATNFYGTLIGSVGTATTSQNINTTAATTAGAHYLLFSPVNATASGVAVSSDAQLQFNPGTNVLTVDVFSGNLSATAATATNFYGTHIGNVTGTATTSQNINTTSATTAGVHYLLFSPVNATASGVAVSSDSTLQFNPGTNVLTTDVFSGNLSATAATATNFFGTHVGAVTGNVTGTATTSQNVNTVSATTSVVHYLTFSPVNGASGVALSSDAQLTYNPGTDVLSATTFSGNVSGTAITATNFYGTLIGSVGSATTSQNINTTAATTAGAHYLLFSPVNATTSGVAVSSDAQLQFNPGTNVLTADVFSGNLSATAATATNFFGTLTGNVTGTATTATNINVVNATTNSAHPLHFSPSATGSGLATSSNTTLSYNPSSFILSVSGLAVTSGTASTSSTTGGLIVSGGVGIGGSIFGGSTISAADNIEIKSGKELRLNNSGNTFYTGLKAGANTSNTTYTFPVAFPGAGTSVLQSDTSGTLTWVAMASGSGSGLATTATNVQVNIIGNPNSFHPLLMTPVQSSAGSAVSANGTLLYNPSTEILSTPGLAVTSGVDSTNTTSGALQVRGGIGATGTSYFQTISVASLTGTGNAVINGNFTFNGIGVFGNATTDTINSLARYISDILPSADNSYDLGNNALGWRNFRVSGVGTVVTLSVTSSTVSTSTTTGALTVTGGVGIGGSLYTSIGSSSSVSGVILANGNVSATTYNKLILTAPASSATLTLGNGSSLITSGGHSLTFNTSNTTSLTLPTTGTLATTSNKLSDFAATTSLELFNTITGETGSGALVFATSPDFTTSVTTGSGTFALFNATATTINAFGAATVMSIGAATGKATFNSTDDSSSTITGGLVVSGGAGIAKSVSIGGRLQMFNGANFTAFVSSASGNTVYTLPATSPATGSSVLQSTSTGVMSWVPMTAGGSGSPGGSNKQIQYNNSSAFGGASGFEYTTGGTAVTVSIFSPSGTGYTSGLWISAIGGTVTRVGIGLSNPQYELEILGEISATNKSFVINHPTKQGMKLRYGSLEGPENGVYVRGELNNSNIIRVPDHWLGLVHEDSYTVHLTPIGIFSHLYVEKIENYNVYVADNNMNPIHCYYNVWAERKDIPKLVTEY